jgi:hypothetical protein
MALLQSRPPTAVLDIMGVDREGRYWITGLIPTGTGTGRGDRRYIVEVIDPTTRELVLSQPVEGPMRFLPGGEYAFSIHADSDGVQSFTVWRVGIRR